LEFPVVALADLGKTFNEQDLRGEIILDEKFGLCPRVKPPKAGGYYSGLSYWLAQKNQKHELRGEELRLLYVALTRPRDQLVLSGNISETKWENFFENRNEISEREILSARSFLDWIGLWFAQNVNGENELPHLRWRIIGDEELANEKAENGKRKAEKKLQTLDEKAKAKIQSALNWKYKFDAATRRAAKSSVTVLRREANAELDEDAESVFSFQFSAKRLARTPAPTKTKLSATDTGTAAHKFLQHFNFESAANLKLMEAEAARLERENYLSVEEKEILDLQSLAAFWNSETGKRIISNKEFVRRELPFTAKFSPRELDEILGTESDAELENEFIVVQGVADLALILPKEIWIVDFKTDDVSVNEIAAKTKFYSPQLKLYAKALEKIYSRPVKNCWLHFLVANRTEKI
jgi:ATP-dependent helicase/nuclease subunit A